MHNTHPGVHIAAKCTAPALGLSLVVLLAAGTITPASPNVRADSPLAWPLERWVGWRDEQINHILTSTLAPTGSDTRKMLARKEVSRASMHAYTVIQECLKADSSYFSKDAGRARELGNFVRFVKAQQWMVIPPGAAGKVPYGLGLEVPDEQYWNLAKPYLEFPELLKSQRFLTAMASPGTYRQALEMIDSINANLPPERKWISLLFDAQFITTVDDAHTYGRMLVMVPNEPVGNSEVADRWIQFGIADPGTYPETRSVSMFTVVRNAETPAKTTTYFSDFMRIRDKQTGKFSIRSNFTMLHDPSLNCYNCHKSSVLPIHPAREYVLDSGGKLAENRANAGELPAKLNNLIMGYGPPNYVYQDTFAYGPCLGPTNRYRSDAFLKSATAGLDISPTSYDRIRNAMHCSNCHNNFGVINYPQAVPTDLDLKAFRTHRGMVQTLVEQGTMPPGNTLTARERQALWRCLMSEYLNMDTKQGILADWLRGDSVSASPAVRN